MCNVAAVSGAITTLQCRFLVLEVVLRVLSWFCFPHLLDGIQIKN